MTDVFQLTREIVIMALAVIAYCALGFVLLLAIERRLYGGETPRYYQGLVASMLQTVWPVSLTILALVGLVARRRNHERREQPHIRSVSH
ncbi:hypothetical protein A3E39_01835 [Candidatus Uhrbacteria bacterium RIFCSPHIGHO2_12_FULL_60_25]|uniref:DUF5671 domain-containing protein n=1 Tax=Candidatus Uhrbacteria bacterium RIFCSPHIGHO2_12_FULL_60_25 TaxID=1802399 RepID=A0A1F7UN83_9BACT|nr:MAG: hypothetical protein A3D73_02510 [Candidatus Uhrbacteria bacterium RIFCSPHIGHO2_02_FULL_60_44]OGL79750.1 MAG: hypothetical protein A3E39_01835 [Candidatus Uhrbacteria bacterium RIFCSPHIGHO2_12_FULL_60_25]